MAFSPLNAGYSPLNAVTVTLPLNTLAGDLKPWSSQKLGGIHIPKCVFLKRKRKCSLPSSIGPVSGGST